MTIEYGYGQTCCQDPKNKSQENEPKINVGCNLNKIVQVLIELCEATGYQQGEGLTLIIHSQSISLFEADNDTCIIQQNKDILIGFGELNWSKKLKLACRLSVLTLIKKGFCLLLRDTDTSSLYFETNHLI